MGFWKSLMFWDTDAVIESTLEAVSNDYSSYEEQAPDRDPHFWLAAAFSNRPGYRPGKDVGEIVPFTRTTMFSVLGDKASVALGYYFLSQEMAHALPKFETKWTKILQPASDLVTQRRFLKTWEKLNPWTCKNIPLMREVVAQIEKGAK